MGLRTGTPGAEAADTTRSARRNPVVVQSGGVLVRGRRPISCPGPGGQPACASAIDVPSRPPASHWAQQCRIQAASPSRVPVANPSAAER